MGKPKKILVISSDKNLREVLDFCFKGWGYDVELYGSITDDIALIKKISPDVIIVDVQSATKTHLEICRVLKDDFITLFIPVITLINKRQLRSQLLNLKHGVDDYLIKPPDPLDLRVRVEMAIKRFQYSFYASPLTGLPGGRIIEESLKSRIANKAPFSFGYIDIDNFKYFNDVYGYIKGDSAIMHAAYMLYTTIKRRGNNGDFIGHIGGDDFVFITTPDKYKEICRDLISTFNALIPFHYSAEDRSRGFIVAKDRSRQVKNIPLMGVSIAVVNKDTPSGPSNIIEINERIAEVKRYLKNFQGSKFMEDRRDKKAKKLAGPVIYKHDLSACPGYKPLGQRLLEKKLITGEKLNEALLVHWRRGLLLGDILKELGFVKERDLDKALQEASLKGGGAVKICR